MGFLKNVEEILRPFSCPHPTLLANSGQTKKSPFDTTQGKSLWRSLSFWTLPLKLNLVKFLWAAPLCGPGGHNAFHQHNRKIEASLRALDNLLLGMCRAYRLHPCMFPYKYNESYIFKTSYSPYVFYHFLPSHVTSGNKDNFACHIAGIGF